MLCGEEPFLGADRQEVYKKITRRQLIFPEHLDSETLDLLNKLFNLDPSKRLGCNPDDASLNIEGLKSHPFFKGMNFRRLDDIPAELPSDLLFYLDKLGKE